MTTETQEDTGRGIVSDLKGFTDKECRRHYYPVHEEWQISECAGAVLKFDLTGQAEVLLTRDEAEDLSRLLRHFADHGTLPAPYKQEPSPVYSDDK